MAPYRRPHLRRSIIQIVDTAVPFAALWLAMLWSLEVGYWLTLLLSVPTSLLLVRLFILQHDCSHGSFFRSRTANATLGSILGVLTLVPFAYWRRTHALHHASSGNLDVRGFGDIDTLTVQEYLSRSRGKRALYRLYRHPLVLLLVGPTYQFVVKHRWPLDMPRSWRREWASVHWTNLGIVAVVAVMWLAVGIEQFLLVQVPVTLISGSIGVYLFYVQHQYEDTYWRYKEAWDYYAAGLEGASLFVLPKVLQWFTGNIGLHHIHHLSPKIPNYHLQRCYDENSALHRVTRLTIGASIRTLWLTLWDESERRLVRFRDLRAIRRRLEEAGADNAVAPTKPDAVPKTWR